MKYIVFLLMCCCMTAEIPAQGVPSTDESTAAIAQLRRQIDSLDTAINSRQTPPAAANDLTLRFRRSALNSLFSAFASHRTDDIRLTVLPTRPVWRENKSLFGMTIQNAIDVDTGSVLVDIKKFECSAFNRNTVDISLEIEGGGMIGVSGRYAGVPLHASPMLTLYLLDKVTFSITAAGADNLLLKPNQHTFLLKTKMSIQFLQWTIPYYREVPIEAEGILRPIVLPLSVSSTVMFPAPWAQDASRRLDFIPRKVRLTHTSVWAEGEVLEFRADINFTR
jgi:hypothetical protein